MQTMTIVADTWLCLLLPWVCFTLRIVYIILNNPVFASEPGTIYKIQMHQYLYDKNVNDN